MECVICKTGMTSPGKAMYSIEKDGHLIVIKNVDADICNNCGEAYFSIETSNWLSEKVKEAEQSQSGEEIIRT